MLQEGRPRALAAPILVPVEDRPFDLQLIQAAGELFALDFELNLCRRHRCWWCAGNVAAPGSGAAFFVVPQEVSG